MSAAVQAAAGPGVPALLAPKLRAAGRRAGGAASGLRIAVLGGIGLVFWLVLYGVLHRLLVYFRGAEGIGDVLAAKLLGLILMTFLSVLLLSNVVTALSTFFLARDLEMLLAAPVDGVRLYLARLLETMLHSSWMVVLVLVPVLVAYGQVYGGRVAYAAVAAATLACFLVLPAVVGAGVTLLLVNVFPARRARDLLALLTLFAGAGLVVLVRLLRPERLARPEGFRDLVDFVAALRAPSSPWLPSEWAADALMAALGSGGDLFPLLLLASTAAAFLVLGAWANERWYRGGFSRAQEGAERRRERRSGGGMAARVAARVPTPVWVMMAKDVRTFFRDTSQWSQLILLGVLVLMYTYNVKVLPLWTGEQVSFLLVNVISFLNLGLAGFVLAAIAARFVFPAVSLEGRTFWLLRSSPVDLRTMLWCKFVVGLVPLLVLALLLTATTNAILRVGGFIMAVSLVTITGVTAALAALALGFGAAFPRFDMENAAQIPTGFGGFAFMMTAIVYLAVVIGVEAWPVHAYLSARLEGAAVEGPEVLRLSLGLGLAGLVTLVAIVVPLRVAVRRMEALGR
ncbi:MAG TPA: hypothetical protein VF192_15640 [Longimicrobiales bacterium]